MSTFNGTKDIKYSTSSALHVVSYSGHNSVAQDVHVWQPW